MRVLKPHLWGSLRGKELKTLAASGQSRKAGCSRLGCSPSAFPTQGQGIPSWLPTIGDFHHRGGWGQEEVLERIFSCV